ncbi:hypothetical protein ACRQ4C_07955 [Curtobacterium sp. SP.BCp]|uniref:hypothetical protein n=1 Tax=Curtobacterium sp. SP.BCp TaxID=3435230 RepID=UPI003F73B9E1
MSTTPPSGPTGEPQQPGQQYPAQPQAGQQYPAQPQAGQQYPAQPQAGQQYPAQPQAGQQYPEQPQPGPPYPGQPYPGAAPYAPPPKAGRSRAAAIGITIASVVVAAVVAFGVRYAITSAMQPSAEEQVQQGVTELKKDYDLPKQIDSVTTLTDIEARGKAIRYDYTISESVDSSSVQQSTLRQSVVSNACTTSATKKLLDDGIGMQYHYVFASDQKTLDLAISKADC